MTFARPVEEMYTWGLKNQAALDSMEANLHAARLKAESEE
jgi:hypothetical protein